MIVGDTTYRDEQHSPTREFPGGKIIDCVDRWESIIGEPTSILVELEDQWRCFPPTLEQAPV